MRASCDCWSMAAKEKEKETETEKMKELIPLRLFVNAFALCSVGRLLEWECGGK